MNRNTTTVILALVWLITLGLFIETKGPLGRILLPLVTVGFVFYGIFLTIAHFVGNKGGNEQNKNKKSK